MLVFLPGVSLDLSCFYDMMVVIALRISNNLLFVYRATVDSVCGLIFYSFNKLISNHFLNRVCNILESGLYHSLSLNTVLLTVRELGVFVYISFRFVK